MIAQKRMGEGLAHGMRISEAGSYVFPMGGWVGQCTHTSAAVGAVKVCPRASRGGRDELEKGDGEGVDAARDEGRARTMCGDSMSPARALGATPCGPKGRPVPRPRAQA
jgi:hypothetical protein